MSDTHTEGESYHELIMAQPPALDAMPTAIDISTYFNFADVRARVDDLKAGLVAMTIADYDEEKARDEIAAWEELLAGYTDGLDALIVPDHLFSDYSEEQVAVGLDMDEGMISSWPFNHLDWHAVESDLQREMDQTIVEIDGKSHEVWVKSA